MKLRLICIALMLSYGCSTAPTGNVETNPEVLILGTWNVSNASVDGQTYPITNPGFGQVQAIFEADNFTYIYPHVEANGLPTGRTDTLNAFWTFNASYDTLRFTDKLSSELVLIWHVKELKVGLLSTDYVTQRPDNAEVTSFYDIDYKLK